MFPLPLIAAAAGPNSLPGPPGTSPSVASSVANGNSVVSTNPLLAMLLASNRTAALSSNPLAAAAAAAAVSLGVGVSSGGATRLAGGATAPPTAVSSAGNATTSNAGTSQNALLQELNRRFLSASAQNKASLLGSGQPLGGTSAVGASAAPVDLLRANLLMRPETALAAGNAAAAAALFNGLGQPPPIPPPNGAASSTAPPPYHTLNPFLTSQLLKMKADLSPSPANPSLDLFSGALGLGTGPAAPVGSTGAALAGGPASELLLAKLLAEQHNAAATAVAAQHFFGFNRAKALNGLARAVGNGSSSTAAAPASGTVTKWNVAHVKIAWQIYHHQQRQQELERLLGKVDSQQNSAKAKNKIETTSSSPTPPVVTSTTSNGQKRPHRSDSSSSSTASSSHLAKKPRADSCNSLLDSSTAELVESDKENDRKPTPSTPLIVATDQTATSESSDTNNDDINGDSDNLKNELNSSATASTAGPLDLSNKCSSSPC